MTTLQEPTRLPKPDALPEASTRQRFLDAGARVFVRHGYAGASMEQVADDADLSRAALYKHFANKEALFLAVATSLHQGASEASRAAAERARRSAAAPTEAILEFMLVRHRYYATHIGASPHAAELAEESSRRCGALVRKHSRDFRTGLAKLVAEYAANGRIVLKPAHAPAAVADMLIAAAKGLKSAELQVAAAKYEAAFELMARTILAGASARHGS
jgi:AcrR family transcriptional regulator